MKKFLAILVALTFAVCTLCADEAYQLGVEADSEFNINASQVLENSTKRKIEIDLRQTEYNKSLPRLP